MRLIKNIFHYISAYTANLIYFFPSRNLTVIAVTGTSGKTTVCHMIYKVLKDAGVKTAMVSTIGAYIGSEKIDTGFHVTTPSPWLLQKLIRRINKKGVSHLVLEVTSHSLDQGRIEGIPISTAVYTNITHEHLDYHKSFEKYQKTKAILVGKTNRVVLNRDDGSFVYLRKKAKGKVISYSLNNKADVNKNILPKTIKVRGDFNRENMLASFAACKEEGIDESEILKSLSRFEDLEGRMEEVKTGKDFKVFIDFAHKPDALEKALTSFNRMKKKGRIISVFGCAGLRDVLKRPVMGTIAAYLSDFVILTAEDPRTEDVRKIIDQIAGGMGKIKIRLLNKGEMPHAKGRHYWKIPDRQEAINFAVRKLAQKNDIVVIFGKGHEKSMCWGKKEFPWSDRDAVLKALLDL